VPRRADPPDADLELAVALVNTVDLLEDPPDLLTGDDVARRLLARNGAQRDVEDWREGDVVTLRDLRTRLTAVFEAAVEDPDRAVLLLNRWLAELPAVPQLAAGPDGGWAIVVAAQGHGVTALETRLPAALARFVARWGPRRLGRCTADPCRCAYLDRTPAGTRRYCCELCNDRMAAAAYRRRGRS
jgi:predicted RNA-binding Zn ribbon-like protein